MIMWAVANDLMNMNQRIRFPSDRMCGVISGNQQRMEALLLVLATLALLSPCRGDLQEYCSVNKCPEYQVKEIIHGKDFVIEKRFYNPTVWLKIGITDATLYYLKEGNSRLSKCCEELRELDKSEQCDKWPVEVSSEGGKTYLLWPISLQTSKLQKHLSNGVFIEERPAQLIYAMKFTGMPAKDLAQSKHEQMVAVLIEEKKMLNCDDFIGATYNGWNFMMYYDNEILILAYE